VSKEANPEHGIVEEVIKLHIEPYPALFRGRVVPVFGIDALGHVAHETLDHLPRMAADIPGRIIATVSLPTLVTVVTPPDAAAM